MAHVELFDHEIDRLLKHRDGPVSRHMRFLGRLTYDYAVENAPVDTTSLIQSLGVHDKWNPDDGQVVEVGSRNLPAIAQTYDKNDYDYSEDVELGIPSRPNYPAQPYLRPALMRALTSDGDR